MKKSFIFHQLLMTIIFCVLCSGNIEAQKLKSDPQDLSFFSSVDETDQPYARGTAGYQGIPEQDVYEMLDDLKSRFSIDEDRIYLTGLSMGGGGTVWLSLTRPDIWAAIAPCCPAPPDDSEELASNACNLPDEAAEAMKASGVVTIKE